MQRQEYGEESFMGYDFSQGYTSLEQSNTDEFEVDDQPGVLARWRAQREEEKRQKQEEEDRDMERQLDLLLEKLHTHGDGSMTATEKRRLQDISDRLRQRGRPS
jgi:stage IV sporulation protein FB